MIFEITLRIPTKSEKICRSILEALEPDNATVPQGITIAMRCEDPEIVVIVKAEDVNILTFRNTVDDILVHINIGLRSLSVLDEGGTANKIFKLSQHSY
jgi:tRNA threonylcarbamoyladenosine modification (KEOPS) complex  Pcc1 subunit